MQFVRKVSTVSRPPPKAGEVTRHRHRSMMLRRRAVSRHAVHRRWQKYLNNTSITACGRSGSSRVIGHGWRPEKAIWVRAMVGCKCLVGPRINDIASCALLSKISQHSAGQEYTCGPQRAMRLCADVDSGSAHCAALRQ